MGERRFVGFQFGDAEGRLLAGTPADPARGGASDVLGVDEGLHLAARNPGTLLRAVFAAPGEVRARPFAPTGAPDGPCGGC